MSEEIRPASEGETPAVPVAPELEDDASWWERYRIALRGLTPTAQRVVEIDARFLAESCYSQPSDEWSDTRVRTGMVVGSVQSGKTASMLALSALMLDNGVDVLVILAGTRLSLWRQTYDRVLAQLDGTTAVTYGSRRKKRVIIPSPEYMQNADVLQTTEYLRGEFARRAEFNMKRRRPLILVVPKTQSLHGVSKFLREVVESVLGASTDRTLQMLVIDDEADDGSVMDAGQAKSTPRFIQGLWAPGVASETYHPRLYATYIAYTATPMANYLQASHNPLSPSAFHAALRVPYKEGEIEKRATTFHEPAGVASYYCGGDMFYEELAGRTGDLCVVHSLPEREPSEDEETYTARLRDQALDVLGDSLRSFFVGGAVRLLQSGASFAAATRDSALTAEQLTTLPSPHSMMFHPSFRTDDHFQRAKEIAAWSRTPPSSALAPFSNDPADKPVLSVEGLTRRLEEEEPLWRRWVAEFNASVSALNELPGGKYKPVEASEWGRIMQLLRDEVFPHAKVRVINSTEDADDRPNFAPTRLANDAFEAPNDIYTIFVSGNVLSRGLTVEGLCTSLFLRESSQPLADTQMQMQRWFGYRGSHLPFCRVFLYEDQLELFRDYHQNDKALKLQVLHRMDASRHNDPDTPAVLEGRDFAATGKVFASKMPLFPGPKPFVRLVETEHSPARSAGLGMLRDLLSDGDWQPVEEPKGQARGTILAQPIGLLETADLLDRLRYGAHDPDPSLPQYERWRLLQDQLGGDWGPFLRTPGENPGEPLVSPSGCPFSIAAYLRLWHAALGTRDPQGFRQTGTDTRWNLVDRAALSRRPPRFYVGVRFGQAGRPTTDELSGLPLEVMDRGISDDGTMLTGSWGTRGGGQYLGDEYFDYHLHQHSRHGLPHREGARPVSGSGTIVAPGLVLFHVVRCPDGGESVAVGLGIPLGGPDHIQALRTMR